MEHKSLSKIKGTFPIYNWTAIEDFHTVCHNFSVDDQNNQNNSLIAQSADNFVEGEVPKGIVESGLTGAAFKTDANPGKESKFSFRADAAAKYASKN